MMRVLYFSFVELDVPQAPRTHTLGIVKGFARHGCHVDALVPKPLKPVPGIENLRYVYLRPWQFSRIGAIWVRLLSGILMFWLCMKNRYDFIYVRELEINPAPRWCSKLFNIPLYIEINDLLVPFFVNKGASARWVAAVACSQKSDFRQAAGLIVNSIPMRQWLLAHYDLKPEKLHFLINGAELPETPPLSKEEARKRLNLPTDSFCIGFVGNIYDRYDFDTLLRAVGLCHRQLPELHLLFVGDGPLKPELERRTSEAGMEDKVLFTGYIASDALGDFLPAMDVGLSLGSRYFTRTYGSVTTKVATYGIFGIPVIVSAASLDGYPEPLKEALLTVQPEDAPALSKLIMQIHRRCDELKKSAEKLHFHVKSDMTWDAVAAKILRAASKRVMGVQRQAAVRGPSLEGRRRI
jgi:glycosyltransferase involved in cell wall biosynthesis